MLLTDRPAQLNSVSKSRYQVTIINKTTNPWYTLVGKEITEAILKERAQGGKSALYWSQSEQERQLVDVYEKWAQKGGVWSAGSARVHSDQLAHVKKGCLARPRQDVRSDGSRIEGSHKGWNSLQRSFSSGLEVFACLGHDFVLRRNLRVAHSQSRPESFVKATFGLHLALITFTSSILFRISTTLSTTQIRGEMDYKN